jgi:hypothetical protein
MDCNNVSDTIKDIMSLRPELGGILLPPSRSVQTFFVFYFSRRAGESTTAGGCKSGEHKR